MKTFISYYLGVMCMTILSCVVAVVAKLTYVCLTCPNNL